MRTFLTSKNQVIDRDHAWRCFAVNVGLTPGLGSLFAGRWLTGLPILALALLGFCLFTLAMWRAFVAAVNSPEPHAELAANAGPVLRGFGIFLVAWFSAAIDSWLLLRASPKTQRMPPIVQQPP
jgi:hypothetical protein